MIPSLDLSSFLYTVLLSTVSLIKMYIFLNHMKGKLLFIWQKLNPAPKYLS